LAVFPGISVIESSKDVLIVDNTTHSVDDIVSKASQL
jgi:hypothetical protein